MGGDWRRASGIKAAASGYEWQCSNLHLDGYRLHALREGVFVRLAANESGRVAHTDSCSGCAGTSTQRPRRDLQEGPIVRHLARHAPFVTVVTYLVVTYHHKQSRPHEIVCNSNSRDLLQLTLAVDVP
jgi:hypothetical protein